MSVSRIIGRITVRSSIRAGSKNNPEGFTWICMQKKNTKNHFLNKHRYLLVGILCLFGICLLSAQDKKKVDSIEQKKTETPEKKKTRVDLLYAIGLLWIIKQLMEIALY